MKAVLTFHSVDVSGSVISVTPSELAKQLREIKASGAGIVPLESLREASDDAVAITFDDGFSNFAEAALPVLREHQAPATVFIVAGCTGSSNDWERNDSRAAVPVLPLMGWDEIRSLGDDVAIGAHGLTHRSLERLDSQDLESEIAGCASLMKSELGKSPAAFAFPYGDYDDAAVQVVARHFALACTTEFTLVGSDDDGHRLPRLDAFYFRDNSMLSRFGTVEFAAWVQLRRAARRARRSLRLQR